MADNIQPFAKCKTLTLTSFNPNIIFTLLKNVQNNLNIRTNSLQSISIMSLFQNHADKICNVNTSIGSYSVFLQHAGVQWHLTYYILQKKNSALTIYCQPSPTARFRKINATHIESSQALKRPRSRNSDCM